MNKKRSCIKDLNISQDSNNLDELVKHYLTHKQKSKYSEVPITHKQERELYLESLKDNLDFLCGEHNDEERRKKHKYLYNGHQNNLQSYFAGTPVVDNLLEYLKDINRETFKDFDELYDYVMQIKRKNKDKTKGFGYTCIYDFSLRYGWNHNPKILPRKFVYVHAHPKTCAQHLSELGFITSKVRTSTYRIPIEDFSEEILQPGMTAADIEDFLCVYRKEILKIK